MHAYFDTTNGHVTLLLRAVYASHKRPKTSARVPASGDPPPQPRPPPRTSAPRPPPRPKRTRAPANPAAPRRRKRRWWQPESDSDTDPTPDPPINTLADTYHALRRLGFGPLPAAHSTARIALHADPHRHRAHHTLQRERDRQLGLDVDRPSRNLRKRDGDAGQPPGRAAAAADVNPLGPVSQRTLDWAHGLSSADQDAHAIDVHLRMLDRRPDRWALAPNTRHWD